MFLIPALLRQISMSSKSARAGSRVGKAVTQRKLSKKQTQNNKMKTKQNNKNGHISPFIPQNQLSIDNHYQMKIQFSPRGSFCVNKPFLSADFHFSLSIFCIYFIYLYFPRFFYTPNPLHVFYGFQSCFYGILNVQTIGLYVQTISCALRVFSITFCMFCLIHMCLFQLYFIFKI